MRILMFNYEYPPLGGGGAVIHELLAEELARRHRVVVVTSAFAGLPRRETRGGVEIRRTPVLWRREKAAASLPSLLSYPPAAWLEVRKLLKRESFDIINSHFAVPTGVVSIPVARRLGIPHVLTIHGGDIYDPSKRLSPHRVPPLRWAVSGVLRKSDVVVAQSENTRDNAQRYYRHSRPIFIVPLGIRIPTVPPATRRELGIPPDRFVVVTVGRLVRRKAVDQLLRLLADPTCAAAHAVVVGSGPEMDSLKSLARELDVFDRVQFTGWVSEERKWQILKASDAYLSTSMHEGFGLVFLEGMAAGLPVIAGDHGGQVDFLRDGETGFVAPAGDLAAFARALARLIGDPTWAREVGRRNMARVESFRIERCAEAYEAIFEEAVNSDSSASPFSTRSGLLASGGTIPPGGV